MSNYDKIVFNKKGQLNPKGHASLSMENDADLAGQFEATKFRECVDDYVANFQLLNRNLLNSVADLGLTYLLHLFHKNVIIKLYAIIKLL